MVFFIKRERGDSFEAFGGVNFLNKNLRRLGVDGFHDRLVFVASFNQFEKAMGNVVGEITNKFATLGTHFDLVFGRRKLNWFTDI